MKKFRAQQSGSVLLAIIIMLPFLILICSLYMDLAVSSVRLARKDQMQTHAQLAADSGVDKAIQDVNQSETYAGSGGEQQLQDTSGVRTTYETTVASPDDFEKIVTSVGKSYQGSNTTPSSSITVVANLRGIKSGDFSVVSGVGGLTMNNSSKVVNGSVYVNGKLTMNGTSQIGLSILPVNVKVAHQSCPSPADATYPQVCGAGENGQPITLNTSAHIYGRVEATNQTNGAGMTNTGLAAGSSAPAVSLPEYDRNAQKSAVSSEQSGAAAGCSNGFKTWPANLKINGDVTISGLCQLTLEGNVWITGNLVVRNSAKLVTKLGLTTPPVIMIDGANGLNMRNSSALLPNLGLVGTRIITYANSTGDPDATPTGASLFSSQSMITIDMDNTASGGQTEFYARWSKLTAGNNGSIGALAGQTIELKNSIAITLGTSVTGFSDIVWVVDSVRRDY